MDTIRRALLTVCTVTTLSGAAAAQDTPRTIAPTAFVEITPTEGGAPVWIAASQVVRVARVENYTVIDTSAWVQQRTIESVEVVARRVQATGQRLIGLTDLSNRRIYLAADRVVLVRDSHERHAAGARAAIVLVGLRFNTDVAVRERAAEVLAALRREGPPEGAGATR